MIIDLGYQLGIGINHEPLLGEKAFLEYKGKIGVIASGTFTDRIIFYEQRIDARPVHNGVSPFHSLSSLVLSMEVEREIGKGNIGFHILEVHSSSRDLLI